MGGNCFCFWIASTYLQLRIKLKTSDKHQHVSNASHPKIGYSHTKSIFLTLDTALPKFWIEFWTGFTRSSMRLLCKEGTLTMQHKYQFDYPTCNPLPQPSFLVVKVYIILIIYATPTHFLNKGGLLSFKLGSLCMISLWIMARRICKDLTSSSTWLCRSFSSISSSSLNEILWRSHNLWMAFMKTAH